MNLELRGVCISDLTDAEVDDVRRQLAIPDEEIDAEVAARSAQADDEALIGTAEAGRRLGFSAEWVRDHAKELGGWRAGDGPKAQWRFDPANLRRSAPLAAEVSPPSVRRRRASNRDGGHLLRVRGESV